jgi:hypothetical protein
MHFNADSARKKYVVIEKLETADERESGRIN